MQDLYWIGFGCCLGFIFGIGCALAVMYSIYLGGYRAAVKDFQLDRTASGFRFACVVTTADGSRRLTADAVTEAEAIHQALARAEVLR